MLTRALFALVLIAGLAGHVSAEDTKLLALGIADHEITVDELDKGGALSAPRFNTPALAYAELANVKKGDTVEVALANEEKALLRNSETLADDQATYLLQAGKRGVPAGGWPQEWKYSATVKVTRDGKPLIEETSKPIPFD
jgi:hypothetical protein